MHEFGIPWPAGWAVMRLRVPEMAPDWTGDVDIIAGKVTSEEHIIAMSKEELRLKWMRSAIGGPKFWQPTGTSIEFSFEHLVGIEVKCAVVELLRPEGGEPRVVLRSGKGGRGKTRRLQGQLRKLLGFGLDHVVLLDVTAGVPVEAKSIGESISWGAITTSAVDRHHPRRRTASDVLAKMPVAHYECSLAPLRGSTEEDAGIVRVGPHRRVVPNPQVSSGVARQRRTHLVHHLIDLFRQAELDGVVKGIPVVLDHSPQTGRLAEFDALSLKGRGV